MAIVDFSGRRSEKKKGENFVMEMTLKKLSLLQGGTHELTAKSYYRRYSNSLEDFDN
jgi:hypothetical protein